MLRLLLNADDLGMSPAINDAVAEGFAAGWLTSASLAVGGSFGDAVRRLGDRDLGVHLLGRDPQDWARQVARVRAEGIEPTHLDSHEHVHFLAPTPFFVFARSVGIRAIRAPGDFGRAGQWAVRGALRRWRFRRAASDLLMPDNFVNATLLRRTRRTLHGTIEVMFHPGNDHDPRYADEIAWARGGFVGLPAHERVGWGSLPTCGGSRLHR